MSRSRSRSPRAEMHERERDLPPPHVKDSPPRERERERERSPPRFSDRRSSRSRSPVVAGDRGGRHSDYRGNHHRGRSPHSRSRSLSPRDRDYRSYHHHHHHGGGRRHSPDRFYDERRRDRYDDGGRYDDRYYNRRPLPPPPSRYSQRGDDFTRDRRNRTEHPDATPTNVLGVFGLSSSTTKERLQDIFSPFGTVTQLDLIVDRYTNQSKGFGFVYFDDVETATRAREEMNGEMVDGRRVRVDYSLTTKAHDPTPGKYMGRPDQQNDRRSNGGGGSSKENRRNDDRRQDDRH